MRASRLDKAFEQGKNLKEKDPDDLTNAQHYRQKLAQIKDKIDEDLANNNMGSLTKKEFDREINKKADLEIAKSMRHDGRNADGIKKAIEEGSPEAGMLPKDMRESYAADIAKKAEEWWGQVQNQRPERSNFKIDLPPTTPNFTPDIER